MPLALMLNWKAGTESYRHLFTCQYASNSIHFTVATYVHQWLLPRGGWRNQNKIFDNRVDTFAFFFSWILFLPSCRKLGNILRTCLFFLGFPALWYPLMYMRTILQVLDIISGRPVHSLRTHIHGEALNVLCVRSPRLCRAWAVRPILF